MIISALFLLELALCTAALLPELKPGFLSALIGQID